MGDQDIGPNGASGARPWSLGRPYWRLWTASGLSNLADGVLKVALPLTAIQYTRSPTLIAGLTVALGLPWLLFALHAGALADRTDRRRLMLCANSVRACVLAVLVLALLLDIGSIWALYAVALAIGVAETIYDTSAQSILPQLVRRDQLSQANGRLFAVEVTAGEFLGKPLAGFLATAGVAVALAAPSALWAVAVAALLLVRGRFRIDRQAYTTVRADIAEGLRFLWRHRLLRTLAAMTGGFGFAANAMMAVLVLYAVGPTSAMGLSEAAYGVLLTSIAAGSVLGSFVAEWVEGKLGRARSLGLSIIAGSLTLGVPAMTANPYLIGAGFAAGGAGIMTWNVIVVSLRQRITPPRILGRVNSSYRLLAWGTAPLGALTGGLLAELLGLRPVFAIMALLVLTLLAGMTIVTDKRIDAAERDGEHA